MEALRQVEEWPATTVSVGVVRDGDVVAVRGEPGRTLPWASVTKLATALATLVAAEQGLVGLDEPAGPEGSTVRHLLAHASGLPFEGTARIARPGQRRVYSNTGFAVLGNHVAAAAGMPFADYLAETVLRPIGIEAELRGSPGDGLAASLEDLLRFARELQSPSLVSAGTLSAATSVQFPGLAGVLPGFGRVEPNDWGLGFELRDGKSPHWTGTRNSTQTFGHFGGSGAFLWVDPDAGLALGCLTDLPFDDWAKEAWPRLSDAVLDGAG